MINSPDKNIYSAEGYRLPTEAEQEYLRVLEHQANGNLPLADRAWYDVNSHGHTEPVALLKPLVLNGNKIFDLFGNVYEWGQDRNGRVVGGRDPTGDPVPHTRTMRSGCFLGNDSFLDVKYRFGFSPESVNKILGVRFVRTLFR